MFDKMNLMIAPIFGGIETIFIESSYLMEGKFEVSRCVLFFIRRKRTFWWYSN
jgi:hypothetical protein